MQRFVSGVAAAALALGLVFVGAPASASLACPDPQEAISGSASPTGNPIVLGPLETGEITWEMVGRTACLGEHPAAAKVVTPDRTIPLEPSETRVDREQGFTFFHGTLTIDAATLTNADAGEWDVEFTAGDVSSYTVPVDVLRRTTLSFDAGPEPLRRNHRLTFRGVLRVADWERDRYRGLRGEPLRIFAIDSQTTPVWVPLVEPTTGRHGRYRAKVTVAGTDRYQAVYLGTRSIYQASSRIDAVAARP